MDPYDVRVVFLKIESFLFQSYCDVKLKFCLLDTRYRNKLSYIISRKYTIFLIDPYIKVAGLPEDRQTAKQMVLSVMDTKVGTRNFNLSLRRNTEDLVLTWFLAPSVSCIDVSRFHFILFLPNGFSSYP